VSVSVHGHPSRKKIYIYISYNTFTSKKFAQVTNCTTALK